MDLNKLGRGLGGDGHTHAFTHARARTHTRASDKEQARSRNQRPTFDTKRKIQKKIYKPKIYTFKSKNTNKIAARLPARKDKASIRQCIELTTTKLSPQKGQYTMGLGGVKLDANIFYWQNVRLGFCCCYINYMSWNAC